MPVVCFQITKLIRQNFSTEPQNILNTLSWICTFFDASGNFFSNSPPTNKMSKSKHRYVSKETIIANPFTKSHSLKLRPHYLHISNSLKYFKYQELSSKQTFLTPLALQHVLRRNSMKVVHTALFAVGKSEICTRFYSEQFRTHQF